MDGVATPSRFHLNLNCQMEKAETQLARALAVLTEHEFPFSRGMENRLDAYLQLEDLQQLEDSEASVIELQRHLWPLLSELRFDLEQNTVKDVLHAVLRCLSYFLHHRSLAATFSNDHSAFFLQELIRRLFSTSDPTTYKLCLWCLTEQNFPVERHKFLPHTVEGLVQAVVNPFKSRTIEVQALKGLHLLLVKYPGQLGANRSVLSIFIRPIASRLSSNEVSTRTQARLVLEEVSKHVAKWSPETLEMVQDCTDKYVLPAMKCHMDRGRQKDAVYLWRLTILLLKSRFATDLVKLNQVLYIPEKCIKDENAAVRLMAMHAWAAVVDIFHACENWIFNKAVVSVLVGPINVCLEQERLLNVVDAAFLSWRRIVSVAVQDFNVYCKAQQQCLEKTRKQQFVPQWKFWYGELVMSPQLTLMIHRIWSKDSSSVDAELKQFTDFSKRIWKAEERESGKSKSCSSRNESSRGALMNGSNVEGSVATKQQESIGGLSSTGDQTCDRVCITSDLLGIALLLEDIMRAIPSLIKISYESHRKLVKKCAYDLARTTWKGVCQRVLAGIRHKDNLQASKFALRLVRMAIEFSFGILTSKSALVVMAVPSSVAAPTERSGEISEDEVLFSSVGFGLEWQLQLLVPLVSGVTFLEDLQAVVLHPKCKLFDHITQRMGYLKERYGQCATVLDMWNKSEDSKLQLDYSAKSNVLLCLVMNLLFEYAVFVDNMNNDYECRTESTLACLDMILKKLMLIVKLNPRQEARGLEAVICYGKEFVRAAQALITTGNTDRERMSMLDELVNVCKNLTAHTFESQQHTSLLDKHQPRKIFGTATSVTANPRDAPDAEEKSNGIVVHEAEHLSTSFDTSTLSSCFLSGENCKIPCASLLKRSAASLIDEQPKLRRHFQQSPLLSSGESIDPRGDQTTLQKAGDLKQNDIRPSNVEVSLIRPLGSHLAPPKLVAEHAHRLNLNPSQCIYPDLVGCTEKIASLYRHLPMGFKPVFSFYKIKTIGDLSALRGEELMSFGLQEHVSTIRRALGDYIGRQDRMKSLTGSALRHRSGSTTASPATLTPSPHKPTKRAFQVDGDVISSLFFDPLEHKRTKRSLVVDNEKKQESGGNHRKCELVAKSTPCLQSDDTSKSRITHGGMESQDQIKMSEKIVEKVDVEETLDTYTLKLLQHLRRSAYYMNKLVEEEESLQSGEASLQTNAATFGGVITNYHEAHDLVAQLASQLQIAAETSSKRCRKLLEKFVTT